jgi:hypothetical protein
MSTTATVAALRQPSRSPAARRAAADRWFFSVTAIVQVVVIVWGFSPTYFLRATSELPSLSPLLHVHGALFTAWLVLLLAQVALVATRRTPLHRQLGTVGGALAALMLVVGAVTAVDSANRGATAPGMTPEQFLIIPILSIVAFAVLVGAALLLRRRPDSHKRLMMLATAGGLSGAGFGRIPALIPYGPVAFLGLPMLFAVALAIHDIVTGRRLHVATIAGTAFILVVYGAMLTASGTAAWLAVASWLMS